jgi:hypothetical protein
MYLKTILLLTVAVFSFVTLVVFVLHESQALAPAPAGGQERGGLLRNAFELRAAAKDQLAFSPVRPRRSAPPVAVAPPAVAPPAATATPAAVDQVPKLREEPVSVAAAVALDRERREREHALVQKQDKGAGQEQPLLVKSKAELKPSEETRPTRTEERLTDDGELEGEGGEEALSIAPEDHDEHEKTGALMCDGKDTESEVIYWKIVPGDNEFESPITPHHDNHHDRYLTFEYDNGGWNNMRMAIECLIVCAHAMGRTVVLPPFQNLYLLSARHRDKHDAATHSQMGFEDFFALDILRSHKGFHVITMKEFLEKEALVGGLHGKYPPGNTSDAWGQPVSSVA